AGSEKLLLTLKQYMWHQLPVGLSIEKYALLVLLSTGLSGTSVARQCRLSENAVSLYCRQAMTGLDMPPSRLSLYRG
ncbi:transcriptional regulator, partial [Salmonella enterica subsp. enterica serovar Infantis]